MTLKANALSGLHRLIWDDTKRTGIKPSFLRTRLTHFGKLPPYLEHEGFPVQDVELLTHKLDGFADEGVGKMVAVCPQKCRHHIQKPAINKATYWKNWALCMPELQIRAVQP